jgi:hypothetical protein
MFKCYVCKEYKPQEAFSTNASRKNGSQTYCKACGIEKQAEWYYKRKHGITLQERDNRLEIQDGKCAICFEDIKFNDGKARGSNTGEHAVVDHCHSTLKIRGVLCGHCNTGLGAFKDNPGFLLLAVEYLENSVKV